MVLKRTEKPSVIFIMGSNKQNSFDLDEHNFLAVDPVIYHQNHNVLIDSESIADSKRVLG